MIVCRIHHRRSRRGFGTFVAIALLLIVAATLPVLASVFTADAKRTRTQKEDAQLRQLLTAGAAFAKGQATADAGSGAGATTHPTAIALPQELVDDGATVTCSISRESADRVSATIRATLGRRCKEQTVTFARRDGAWHVVDAKLGGD
jgi:hypothetical protein